MAVGTRSLSVHLPHQPSQVEKTLATPEHFLFSPERIAVNGASVAMPQVGCVSRHGPVRSSPGPQPFTL